MQGRIPNCCIVVLCGLPASGKSSLASYLESNSGLFEKVFTKVSINFSSQLRVEVISIDEVGGQSDVWTDNEKGRAEWKEARKVAVARVNDLVLRNNGYLSSNFQGVLIVVDDNSYYRSMRYEYYKIARKYHIGFAEIYCSCLPSICVQRNHDRLPVSSRVSTEVIERMYARFEAPMGSKFHWERYSTVVDSVNNWSDSIEPLCSLIVSAWGNPITDPSPEEVDAEKEKDREVSRNNMMHKIDLMLREVVSFSLKKNKDTVKDGLFADIAQKVCRERKSLLERIRTSIDEYGRDSGLTAFDAAREEMTRIIDELLN